MAVISEGGAGSVAAAKETNPDCPCEYEDCPRHGVCEKCRAYHRGQNEKTCCERKRGAS